MTLNAFDWTVTEHGESVDVTVINNYGELKKWLLVVLSIPVVWDIIKSDPVYVELFEAYCNEKVMKHEEFNLVA